MGKQVLKKGAIVSWTSQAGGHAKTKQGTVVFVYDPLDKDILMKTRGLGPRHFALKEFPDHSVTFESSQWPAVNFAKNGSCAAVFVSVESKTGRAKPKLYMPKLGVLKLIN